MNVFDSAKNTIASGTAKMVGTGSDTWNYLRTNENARNGALFGLGVAAIVTVPGYVLSAMGFAKGGVLASSPAALWQSTYAGFVAKGSLFAVMQSTAATGSVCLSATSTVAVGGAAAVLRVCSGPIKKCLFR